MSCSRLGEDDVTFLSSDQPLPFQARVPLKKTKNTGGGVSVSGNVNIAEIPFPIPDLSVGLGWSVSDGVERTVIDVFDVNEAYEFSDRSRHVSSTLITGTSTLSDSYLAP